jgi:Gpi18-like mannosyltransferase
VNNSTGINRDIKSTKKNPSLSEKILKNNIHLGRLTLPTRFLIPLLITFLAKILAAILIYNLTNIATSNTFWMNEWKMTNPPLRWPFIFLGWDSGHYFNIAQNGYSNPELYAFFPGYPISIFTINLLAQNVQLSAVLSSFIFGIFWVPPFQSVAENYMSRQAALRCTFLMAFFPYTFFFTTVAYSESLLLFATVVSWYFYLKDKVFYASLLTAMATLTRMVGIIIALPMFIDLVYRRAYKRVFYVFASPIVLFLWLGYCYSRTGDWLFSITAQGRYWNMYSFRLFVADLVVNKVQSISLIYVIGVASFFVIGFIIYLGRGIDWRLTVYSIVYFSFIFYFADLWSVIRYLSFIFPLWITLTLRTKIQTSNILLIGLSALFFFVTILLWSGFLLGLKVL